MEGSRQPAVQTCHPLQLGTFCAEVSPSLSSLTFHHSQNSWLFYLFPLCLNPLPPFCFFFNSLLLPFLYSLLAAAIGNENSLLATPRRDRSPSQREDSSPSYSGSTQEGHRHQSLGITLLDEESQAEGTLPADSVGPSLTQLVLVC